MPRSPVLLCETRGKAILRPSPHTEMTFVPLSSAPAGLCVDVSRHGHFASAMELVAYEPGASVDGPPACLRIRYRDNTVAWVTYPAAVPPDVVTTAVLRSASYLLGGRCPDMANHPLTFG